MARAPDARRGATASAQQVSVGEGACGMAVRGVLVLVLDYVEIHVTHGDEARWQHTHAETPSWMQLRRLRCREASGQRSIATLNWRCEPVTLKPSGGGEATLGVRVSHVGYGLEEQPCSSRHRGSA